MFAVLGGVLKKVLLWALGGLLGRLLIGGGLALVSYKFAVQPLFDQLHSVIVSNSGELALAWFGFFDLDKAITLIASAYVVRVAAKSVSVVKKS